MTGTEQEIRDYFDRNIERLIVGISDSSDDYEKARRIIELMHEWMLTCSMPPREDDAQPIIVDETIKSTSTYKNL